MRVVYFILAFLFQLSLLVSQEGFSNISKEYNSFFSEVDGAIWVASAGRGWNQYRGFDTKHYLLNDSISNLHGSYIQSNMYKDKRGYLWSSTYEYLTSFDPKIERFHLDQVKLPKKTIKNGYHVLDYIESKELLYLRAKDTLYTFDPKIKQIISTLGFTIGNSFCTWHDTIAAAPWLNGEGFELWTLNQDNWSKSFINATICPILKGLKVIKIIHFNQKIWLITDDGLIRYNVHFPSKSGLYKYSKEGRNTLIDADTLDHLLLMGTDDSGLVIFDTQKQIFLRAFTNFSNRVDQVFLDQYKRIWLSNATIGLSTYYPHQILHQSLRFNPEAPWKSLEKEKGFEVLVDDGKGIVVTKDRIPRNLNIPSKRLPIPMIRSVKVLDAERIFICGLFDCFTYHWSNDSFKKIALKGVHQIQDVNIHENIVSVIADNKLWKYEIKDFKPLLKSEKEKYQGGFQFVCYQSHVTKTYSHSSTHLLISNAELDTLINVHAFVNDATYDDKSNVYFVATNSGVSKIDDKYRVTQLTVDHPILNHLATYDIAYQEPWIYANNAHYIFRIHNKTNEIQILDTFSFSSIPRFYIGEEELALALDTLVRLPIKNAFDSKRKNSLVLDFFKVNQKFDNIKKDIFEYTQNSFEWRYYVNNSHLPDQCRILYRLTPTDTTWHIITQGESINYNQLLPRSYTLQVKAMNVNGSWTNEVQYAFSIRPPWYQTTWFYVLMVFIIGFVFYLFYKWRVSQIKHQFAIQTEISNLQRSALQAQMNPHFIFNCLNAIQNYIMQNEKLEAMEYLNRFAKLIRQNLHASAENKIRLDDELSMLDNYIILEKMRFQQKFDYAITISDSVDISSVYIPPLLIQPFVENAIIHGVASLSYHGMVGIYIEKTNDIIRITISDNGNGMEKNKAKTPHKSLGMSITQKRLAFINQQHSDLYKIETTSDENGTTITIDVPV